VSLVAWLAHGLVLAEAFLILQVLAERDVPRMVIADWKFSVSMRHFFSPILG
jgi:hypothetical protein